MVGLKYAYGPFLPDGLVFFDHSNLYTPSSEADMVKLVRWAARDGRKMRVVGSGHSWSTVANSPDILVSLCNHKGMCNWLPSKADHHSKKNV